MNESFKLLTDESEMVGGDAHHHDHRVELVREVGRPQGKVVFRRGRLRAEAGRSDQIGGRRRGQPPTARGILKETKKEVDDHENVGTINLHPCIFQV